MQQVYSTTQLIADKWYSYSDIALRRFEPHIHNYKVSHLKMNEKYNFLHFVKSVILYPWYIRHIIDLCCSIIESTGITGSDLSRIRLFELWRWNCSVLIGRWISCGCGVMKTSKCYVEEDWPHFCSLAQSQCSLQSCWQMSGRFRFWLVRLIPACKHQHRAGED